MRDVFINLLAAAIWAILASYTTYIRKIYPRGMRLLTLHLLEVVSKMDIIDNDEKEMFQKDIVERVFWMVPEEELLLHLLNDLLQTPSDEQNVYRVELRQRIIERILQEYNGGNKQDHSIIEYPNQEACETHLRNAFYKAKTIKILTIRGENYFLGRRSLFYDLCHQKIGTNSTIKVLVLSPTSKHIGPNLARRLGKSSDEEIRQHMNFVFDRLRMLAGENHNFTVKCYDETPVFKLLMFDGIMFISFFIGPKNDRNSKMLQITHEGNPSLFAGLEKYFDELSNRCVEL